MKKLFLLSISIILVLVGCNANKSEEAVESEYSLKVYTSIYPLNYLVSEIGGDRVLVENLVPLGTDPHDFEPSLREVSEVREANLFVYNGAGLESWGDSVARDVEGGNVLKASDFVKLRGINSGHREKTSDDKDEHGDSDPHIWLSPKNMDIIAEKLAKKLSNLDPGNTDYYGENYSKLSEKLTSLDRSYREELKSRTSNTVLVSHSAFEYLAKEYGFDQVAVTGISPNAEPSPKTLSELIDLASEKDLRYIYFETLASPKAVEMLSEEANLEPLVLNPIGGLTSQDIEDGDDYISLMEENLENLKKELLK